VLKGFGAFESDLDLSTFDWINGNSDRNWWWQIQALPFLNWFIGCHSISTNEEKKKIKSFVKRSLFNWLDKSIQDIKSPLVWHDHATAFRLRNIVRWINFLVLNDEYRGYLNDAEQKRLLLAVEEHINFLNLEENYSKHTNHGFDQMLVVYSVSLLWSGQYYLAQAGNLAELRLEEELDFAFTSQGVHVENSPGYQKFMISRVELLIELETLGDSKLSIKSASMVGRAKKFLEVITLPNGYIPMIGDTKGDDTGLLNKLTDTIEFYDYSESGYYIAKGLASDGKAIHLVFKCTHLSNYHRHDDDLSFHLFYEDEIIFGDGGLGFYQEKDERRLFLRSNQAHNTIFPLGIKPIRVVSELENQPTMKVIEPGLVVAETSMYGGRLQRVLDVRNLLDFELIIEDKWIELPTTDNDVSCNINFFIPYEISIDKNKKILTKNKKNITIFNSIEENSKERFTFYISEEGCVSNRFASFENATNFGWSIIIKKDEINKTFIEFKGNEDNKELTDLIEPYDNIEFITDTQGRKMFYKFTPAKVPENAPLLVILHGHTYNAKTSNYKNDNWNILCPIDNFGLNKAGAWWLGEDGDYFVKNLLHKLIFKIRTETNSNKCLFFWGSSMGGFGSLLHGMLLNAKAVFSNIPQIKLLETTYSEKNMKTFFEPIFGDDKNSIYNDVTNFINTKHVEDNPLFFLVQSRFDYKNYLEEQGLSFFRKCKDSDINISFEIVPEKGHKVFYTIAESIKKIEKYIDIFEDDIKFINQKNNKLITRTFLNNKSVFLEVINHLDVPYAFYLIHKDSRVDVRWYEYDNTVKFDLLNDTCLKNYYIKIYQKIDNNITYIKKIFICNEC